MELRLSDRTGPLVVVDVRELGCQHRHGLRTLRSQPDLGGWVGVPPLVVIVPVSHWGPAPTRRTVLCGVCVGDEGAVVSTRVRKIPPPPFTHGHSRFPRVDLLVGGPVVPDTTLRTRFPSPSVFRRAPGSGTERQSVDTETFPPPSKGLLTPTSTRHPSLGPDPPP